MSSKSGKCEFCNKQGDFVAKAGTLGIDTNLYVCPKCQSLLSNPITALPLIRGHLSFSSRGKADDRKKIDSFMEEISKWGKLN